MPTENRSSNTAPRDVFIRLNPLGLGKAELRKDSTGFEDQRTHSDYLLFLAGYRETHPEPQSHPEPIAWMVGTAFWWTKEEAERDAAAMGLPVVGLGPMTDRAAIEIAESETMAVMAELAECEAMADMVAEREWAEHVGTGSVSSKVESAFTQLHNNLHEASEKLAERDALLRELADAPPAAMEFRLQQMVKAALSASAEPASKSGWVDWHGGKCPVPDGAEVEYSLLGNPGKVFSAVAARLDWQHGHRPSRKRPNICRYRIKQANASAEPQVKS